MGYFPPQCRRTGKVEALAICSATLRDRFIFNTNKPFTTESVGIDEITDFSLEDGDLILLDARTFDVLENQAGIGFSVETEFCTGTYVPPQNKRSSTKSAC